MTAGDGIKRPYGHRREFDHETEMKKSLKSLYNVHGIKISNYVEEKVKTANTGVGTDDDSHLDRT